MHPLGSGQLSFLSVWLGRLAEMRITPWPCCVGKLRVKAVCGRMGYCLSVYCSLTMHIIEITNRSKLPALHNNGLVMMMISHTDTIFPAPD
ncbi:hypothetical protein BDW74DRAFT_27002 [Aspergillus multicolor]|uniref:uncharacterized protein n=1 Tax=Aspergillus multicolor TaxID=41759 RepID=UPI003CCCD227